MDPVVHRGAGAYISGEETGELDSPQGKRRSPRRTPPFAAIKGLYQAPTLINNVETLSNVPIEVMPEAKRRAQCYRHDSCGKCVPCREETNWTVKMLERIEQGLATPMDLDVINEVNQNIEGNCLCVLGDSMAMPVRSLLKHFRSEFADAMEAGRFSASDLASEHAGAGSVDVRAAI